MGQRIEQGFTIDLVRPGGKVRFTIAALLQLGGKSGQFSGRAGSEYEKGFMSRSVAAQGYRRRSGRFRGFRRKQTGQHSRSQNCPQFH